MLVPPAIPGLTGGVLEVTCWSLCARISPGLWEAALNIQPAIFSTNTHWFRQGGPGKAASRCQRSWMESHPHRHAGNNRMGPSALPPLHTTSYPHFAAHQGNLEGLRQAKHQKRSRAVSCAVGQGGPSTALWAGCLKSLTQQGSKPGHRVLPSPCSAQSRPGQQQGTPSPLSWSSTHGPALVFRS